MMQREVTLAQADTLNVWAAEWGRETCEGATEVSFALGRVARLIRSISSASDISFEDASNGHQIPLPTPSTSVRPD